MCPSVFDLVTRIDDERVAIANPFNVPITLFARQDVPIEWDDLILSVHLAGIQETIDELWLRQQRGIIAPFWGDRPGRLRRMVLTPDFHRSSTIPIGTVLETDGFIVPQGVGNDISCGMRLLATDVRRSELDAHWPALQRSLREVFFCGKRNIPMAPRQREAVFRNGLRGLLETSADNASTGLWRYYDRKTQEGDLARVHFAGDLQARDVFAFERFIRASGALDGRDPQIGSVGGGNHFVELQSVDAIFDGGTARIFGLAKDQVAIMVHTGSVGIGHMVGGHFGAAAYQLYPAGCKHPKHGFYALPTEGPHARLAAAYLDAMKNAAHFAFANRLFLGLMAVRALSETLGRHVEGRLVYDAPHNLIWEANAGFVHRKGATPAFGPMDPREPGPYLYTGQPVLIPGSMGASSYVLAGQGLQDALESACHGAGRALARGRATHVARDDFERAITDLRIVTPLDPQSAQVRSRRDIRQKLESRLMEEAPYAYKPIDPVIETITQGGIARNVARLAPCLTLKG